MNVNTKGVKGLIKVLDDLSEKDFYLFPAFDDHSPVDLAVMDKRGSTIRLQVKYRSPMVSRISERYELTARSMVNGKSIGIDRSLIDGWAVYLSGVDSVKYIPVRLLEGKNGIIINPTENYGDVSDWI